MIAANGGKKLDAVTKLHRMNLSSLRIQIPRPNRLCFAWKSIRHSISKQRPVEGGLQMLKSRGEMACIIRMDGIAPKRHRLRRKRVSQGQVQGLPEMADGDKHPYRRCHDRIHDKACNQQERDETN